MPKINAATVAQHRAAQERALLDAAHELLREGAARPTMAAVAKRAGLARPSVYQYFSSSSDLLQALVRDAFPRWAERVTQTMSEAPTPADKIMAYAMANIDLVADGTHAVGAALATLVPGAELNEQAGQMHRQLQEPLVEALHELKVEDPVPLAEMINSLVHAATRMLESGEPMERVQHHLEDILGPFVDRYR